MIGSISNSSFDYQLSSISNSNSSSSNSLSLDEQEIIEEVLSQYDGSSLSQTDAQSIVSAFQDSGIEPSKELSDTMDSLGFNAQEVGKLGGASPQGGQAMGGMPPPPPPSSSEDEEEEYDTVSTLLETLFESDDEDDAESSSSSSSFDDLMEYTSRIVNLNENSKEGVMQMLEKYGSQSNEFSQEQTEAIVKNSLSSILSDSNNYKHTSFYG